MDRFGSLSPIVIDESGMIVAGDGGYLAAKLLGLKQVPIVRARFLTEGDRTPMKVIGVANFDGLARISSV